jgi:hypothetical protein
MVLGTYHFANPGRDLVKSKIRDTMSADRQREILEVVQRLRAYKPTKIMVEAEPERQAAIDAQYEKYKSGTYNLTANEIDQIGFRLAKELSLPRLNCVDSKLDMDFNGTFGFAMQNGMQDIAGRIGAAAAKIGPIMEELDRKYSVGQLLAIHNNPEYIRQSQSFYIEMTKITANGKFPGADMVGDWYKRNLRIFSNIRRQTEPGDRVLVIFGSGHGYFLNQSIQESLDLAHESPMKFLPAPPETKLKLEF